MAEHEDQIAQYRLKLEETAALVARIRHEINNPLTGVLGQAQLLLREDLSERSRKRVQTIEDLALRLRDIVAQLREVQRPGGEGETSCRASAPALRALIQTERRASDPARPLGHVGAAARGERQR